jgi:tetratricopeptide (TPR) repeat protein
MRIVERLDEALDVLAKAEATATRHALNGELSRVHYFRGNILFPRGDVDGCLREHELARELARAAASPEDEARALSGLGDAYYLGGRIVTAEKHYDACVGLCRDNGYRAIEVANLSMVGHMRLYLNELSAARDDCRSAVAAAAEVGNHRAEMIARGSCLAKVLFDMADFAGAQEELRIGLDLARRLGAQRYEPMYMSFLGKILAIEGKRAEARALLKDAVAVSRETGLGYAGPMALGALALVTDDAGDREQALAEGVALLREPRPSHNYLWFYRDAMEACLGARDWEGVERHARALGEYTAAEPLPWSEFFLARGRALADHGRGAEDKGRLAELRRIGADAGLHAALQALSEIV